MYDQKIKFAMAAADNMAVKSGQKLRILVVDADSWFSSRISLKLVEEGHSVTALSNCYDAWLQARSDNFDLLLIDIEVPAMTGLELVRRVKSKDNVGLIVATSPNVTTRSARASTMLRSHGIAHLLGKEAGFNSVVASLREIIIAERPDNLAPK